MNQGQKTVEVLKSLAEKYSIDKLTEILKIEDSMLFKTDIYICLKGIVEALNAEGDTLDMLKEVKNIYNGPVFAVNPQEGKYLIKNVPDLEKAIMDMEKYSFCFNLSPYHVVNTLLAVIEAQVTGLDLDALYSKAIEYTENSIQDSLAKNPNWNSENLTCDNPVLILPVGAAGCGKSTFYVQLSNVVNISCDNIRYLLFQDFGPCFMSWESALSWWVVNRLTDTYLQKGYSVFYNGVNTDAEYRSPITMENPDSLFKGMPYKIKIAYFEPPVKLTSEELEELKTINLWQNSIEDLDFEQFSERVSEILTMIKTNYLRTLARTKDITEGRSQQDIYDILYAVPAAIVKLFVEQSFNVPAGDNVVVVPRKNIPDASERSAFYKEYADKILT